jgi:Trypsin
MGSRQVASGLLIIITACGLATLGQPTSAFATPAQPLAEAATTDRLVSYAQATKAKFRDDSVFGGVRLADGGDAVEIFLTENTPESRNRVSGGSAPSFVRFLDAKRSLSSLLSMQRQLRDDRKDLEAVAGRVTVTHPDLDTNQLVVGVLKITDEAREAAARRFGDAVRLEERPFLQEFAGRGDDSAPFNGGGFLTAPSTGSNCSAGPPIVKTSTGQTYLLTASHCYAQSTSVVNGSTRLAGDSNRSVGLVTHASDRFASGYDVGLVLASSSKLNFRSSTAFQYAVAQQYKATGAVDNQPVCISGAPSGEVCNTIVSDVDVDNYTETGPTLVNMVLAAHATVAVSGPGDSGGPVYSVDAGGLNVHGIIVGWGGTAPLGVTCRNDAQLANPRGAICSRSVAFQDFNSIMFYLSQFAPFALRV